MSVCVLCLVYPEYAFCIQGILFFNIIIQNNLTKNDEEWYNKVIKICQLEKEWSDLCEGKRPELC